MKNRGLSRGIVGRAFDTARIDFMEVNNFWMNIYLVHLYGDPALRQFGRVQVPPGHSLEEVPGGDTQIGEMR